MSERDLYGKAIFCNSPAGHKDQHAHVYQELTVSPFVTSFQPPKDWAAGAELQRLSAPIAEGFEQSIAKYTLDYGPTSAGSTHGYTHGYRDGAAAQRQVGPCGKHPLACWVERVLPVHVRSNLAIEGGSEITHCCTVCASEQALRAEVAARDATIAELGADRDHSDSCLCETANKLVEVNINMAAREAELTTLRDKLWEMEARVTFLNSWLTKLKESSDDMTKDIAALLAEEAGR